MRCCRCLLWQIQINLEQTVTVLLSHCCGEAMAVRQVYSDFIGKLRLVNASSSWLCFPQVLFLKGPDDLSSCLGDPESLGLFSEHYCWGRERGSDTSPAL